MRFCSENCLLIGTLRSLEQNTPYELNIICQIKIQQGCVFSTKSVLFSVQPNQILCRAKRQLKRLFLSDRKSKNRIYNLFTRTHFWCVEKGYSVLTLWRISCCRFSLSETGGFYQTQLFHQLLYNGMSWSNSSLMQLKGLTSKKDSLQLHNFCIFRSI